MESPLAALHLHAVQTLNPSSGRSRQWGPEPDPGQPFRDLILREIRAIRFENRRPSCVHCGTPSSMKWGAFSGRQRYRCRGCGRTFSDLTGTALAHTKRLVRWPMALHLMEEAATLRRTARYSGIHPSTAFRWRHLVLGQRQARVRPSFRFSLAYHVEPFPLHRQSGFGALFHSGHSGAHQAIHPRFLVAVGRQTRRGPPELRFRWMGPDPSQPSASRLGALLGAWIGRGCELTVKGRHSSGARLARGLGIRWRQDSGTVRPGALRDTRLARAGGREFRKWLRRFRGVAVRYAPNYLEWHLMVREDMGGRADPRTPHRCLPVGAKGLRVIRELVT